eukprot:SAG31_NODE_14874_length_782_cov_2.144949_1_plen_113_part_10
MAAQLVYSEMTAFLDDDKIKENMAQLQADYDQWLNDSGIVIIEPPTCEDVRPCPDGTSLEMGTCLSCGALEMTDDGEYELVDLYKRLGMCNGAKNVPCNHDGYTMDELMGYIG